MWAQLITMRVKAGREADVERVMDQLQAAEQPDSGLLRTTTMRDVNDPTLVYTLVVFESEDKARARENDPRREAGLQVVRSMMAEIFDGPPQFVDLDVVFDVAK